MLYETLWIRVIGDRVVVRLNYIIQLMKNYPIACRPFLSTLLYAQYVVCFSDPPTTWRMLCFRLSWYTDSLLETNRFSYHQQDSDLCRQD